MSLLTPKTWKHRKEHVKSIVGKSSRGAAVAFGDYGLKATTSAYITNRQIESARKVIVRYVKNVGKIWLRVFPNVPLTKKWLEMPMGKGKGDPKGYVAEVLPGRIIFEIDGVTFAQAKEAIRKAGSKVSVRSRMVSREA